MNPQRVRIDEIDILRGLALLGVLTMNLAEAFRVPYWGIHPEAHAGAVDRAMAFVGTVFVSGKSFTLFSMLFGVGLSIFFERASARHPNAMRLLARRLVVLLMFGSAHMFLLWHGDILMSYALIGLFALPFLRARTRVVLGVAVACFVAGPFLRSWPPLREALNSRIPGHYEDALRVYGTGTYGEILRFRIDEFFRVIVRVYGHVWPRELGNMLVGMLIWRSGAFSRVVAYGYRRVLSRIAGGGIALGAGYSIYGALHAPISGVGLRSLVHGLTMLVFALGYGAALLLLLASARWREWLSLAAPIGRMAFTNYLTQTLVFTTLFYGYGFGWLGQVGYAMSVAIGLVFYGLQGILSTVWLRHFAFGPFEWAWRSLTYGEWQPLRRAPSACTPGAATT
ncbi:DUF418 domain-containing protein [Pendulispora rubella]|uniref:DUF418 domain-containing protein n=1 Tax=Pendulispora rubella TaxID=2741070 RepID=A0ABZ2L4A3_9BACT